VEQNNIFIVKGIGGFPQSREYRFLSFALFVCAQAGGKLGVMAISGMIAGDMEQTILLSHHSYHY
jgi:hypothetical protein